MKIDYNILKKYLEGTGTKTDKRKIVSWFDGANKKDLRDVYFRYWNEFSDESEIEDYDEEKILGNIYHQIKLIESQELNAAQPTISIRKVISIFTKVAAVLFIPLVIFTLFTFDRSSLNTSYTEIYAPMGTITKFSLPDSSVGFLNGGSSIKFPSVFKGNTRDVSLQGEAFFQVVSNAQKPFIVSGSKIKVIAYGTSFNVESYSEDLVNKVTLVEGKVKVIGKLKDKDQSIGMLKPGEMCTYNITNSSAKIKTVNAERISSWKEGKLVFIDEPFTEVVKKLSRRYNANIRIGDKELNSFKYLATFENETLDDILKLIELSAPIKVKDLGRSTSSDGSIGRREIEFYLQKD